jgi:VCBS repeat-containing protein
LPFGVNPFVLETPGTIFTPNGNVVMAADGAFTYTPLHNYSGPDSFSYTVSDGQGGTSTVNVGLLVNAVADTPLLSVPENNLGFERGSLAGWSAVGAVAAVQFQNAAPIEKAWMGWLDSGGTSDTSVENFLGLAPGALDQMVDGDATVGSGLKTGVVVSAGDTVSFQWNFITLDYVPYDDFAFVVTPDGVAYKLSDSQQVGGEGGDGTTGWQTFSMVATHTGLFELRFGVMNVLDEQINSTLLVDNVQINGSSPDVRGTQDVPIPLDFATALTDLDGSESVTVVMSNMPQGTVFSSGVDSGDGHWLFTPAQLAGVTMTTPHDFTGVFTLTVTATSAETSNGSTASIDKDVVVMVQPANNAPVAVDDSAFTNEDTQALINVVANDTDPDSEVLTIQALLGSTSALGATLSIVDGNVLYDPSTSAALHALHQGASLIDTFSYVVTDSRGGTSTAEVTVDVAGVNDVGMQGVSLDYT